MLASILAGEIYRWRSEFLGDSDYASDHVNGIGREDRLMIFGRNRLETIRAGSVSFEGRGVVDPHDIQFAVHENPVGEVNNYS